LTSKVYPIVNNAGISYLLGARTTLIFDSNGNGFSDVLLQEWFPGGSNEAKQLFLYQQKTDVEELENSNALKGFTAITPTVKIGDLNNDGIEDLIIYDLGLKIGSDQAYTGTEPVVYFGRKDKIPAKSDILLKAYENYSSADTWQSDGKVSAKDFALADIDNDGDLDIWVESTGGMNVTNHFLVNHGSHFSVDKSRVSALDIQGSNDADFNRYWSAHFADLNSDGAVELILGQSRTDDITHINGTSIVLENDRRGFFSIKSRLPEPSFNDGFTVVAEIASGDLNNDGKMDLILAHRRPGNELRANDSNPGTGNYIQVLIQSDQGEFFDKSSDFIGSQRKWSNDDLNNTNFIANIEFFDANGDGWKDLLVNYWSNFDIVAPVLMINRGGAKLERSTPDITDDYSGEFNFVWNSDQLSKGDIEVITQVSSNEIFSANTLFQSAKSINVSGTNGDDFMDGDSGDDEFTSLAGDDYLSGYGGNDIFRAGIGRDTIIGGNGDDYLGGGQGGDYLSGGTGNDTVLAGNGRDLITGGLGADHLYGGFGHNTFSDEKDGSVDQLYFKSDQFAENWLYGRAGMNPNGQKIDIIKGLDQSDLLFVEGVETSELSFSEVSNFAAPTGNFSGIGIFANGFIEGLYTGGDLSAVQLQSMTVGVGA